MEQEFQRADLEALMGGDELLDGQELSCGFVRITAIGLVSDYTPKWGEKPLFDMSIFQKGDVVLPFPIFSLKQFQLYCDWHKAFRWEVIEAEFTNDDGTIDDAALAELELRRFNAGNLVRGVLRMPLVPVMAGGVSGGVEPDEAAPLPLTKAVETKEQRQDRRLNACIDAGLQMHTDAAQLRLPDGVGNVADCEGVTRQAFTADVKAALKRRKNAIKEGRIIRPA